MDQRYLLYVFDCVQLRMNLAESIDTASNIVEKAASVAGYLRAAWGGGGHREMWLERGSKSMSHFKSPCSIILSDFRTLYQSINHIVSGENSFYSQSSLHSLETAVYL